MAGRPRWEPTTKQCRTARRLARLGISAREISRALRVDPKTLRASELYYAITDAHLSLKVRLMKPILQGALRGYGSDVSRMLKLLHTDDGSSDEAQVYAKTTGNEGNEAQNEPKK